MLPDPRAVRAAAGNAAWCDAVCRASGLRPSRAFGLWLAGGEPPPLHPDAVTLRPGLDPHEVSGAVPARRGASVKDSFADLDLAGEGFEVLFDAQWIWHEDADDEGAARSPRGPDGGDIDWVAVREPAGLEAWAAATGQRGTFTPPLLLDGSVRFLVGRRGPEQVGRAALSVAAGVVSVGNVWAGAPGVWDSLAAAARASFGPRPLAGYESGGDLAAALAAGFTAVGPLRVWTRSA